MLNCEVRMTKTFLTIFIFFSASAADMYQLPETESLDWKAPAKMQIKKEKWAGMQAPNTDLKAPDDKDLLNDPNNARKPSSNGDQKPKFWDYQSVK